LGLYSADFVPPPPELVEDLVDDLIAFSNDDVLAAVAQAGGERLQRVEWFTRFLGDPDLRSEARWCFGGMHFLGVKDADRVRRLHRGQRRFDPELRGAPPLRRGDLERLRGADGQPGGEQAHGEEAADALVAARGPSPAPDPNARTRGIPRTCPQSRCPGIPRGPGHFRALRGQPASKMPSCARVSPKRWGCPRR